MNETPSFATPRAARGGPNLLLKLWLALTIMAVAALLGRIFLADRFLIPSDSMQPVLYPGQHVWVDKTVYGARIYTSFDFSPHSPLKCKRLPALGRIRPGDVVVFNYPFGYDDWSKIEFRINYVYCKRVLGTPGDTIGITDCTPWNKRLHRPFGCTAFQDLLRMAKDSTFINDNCFTAIPLSKPTWTIKDLGPLYVPAKGQEIELDEFTRHLYGHIMEYESGRPADGLTRYVFTHDWFFMLGDNCMNSCDSRYWGFVPDDFIIGKVFNPRVTRMQ